MLRLGWESSYQKSAQYHVSIMILHDFSTAIFLHPRIVDRGDVNMNMPISRKCAGLLESRWYRVAPSWSDSGVPDLYLFFVLFAASISTPKSCPNLLTGSWWRIEDSKLLVIGISHLPPFAPLSRIQQAVDGLEFRFHRRRSAHLAPRYSGVLLRSQCYGHPGIGALGSFLFPGGLLFEDGRNSWNMWALC